ncbi:MULTISPECIES: hypothetical protein [Frankia]|uniref:Uncharacterized protein n=1 Tax=Frankia alni (strain DSM 45986 / CECT 9034 / ACN14a) TaxID=326424 RepID=Q0RMD2_FRAAA|nr:MULTISPECIES: hypothetical protein [Frankia]CAJ61319.1 hypothetical protein FRAAL2673 [Frankia alni ACN14a]
MALAASALAAQGRRVLAVVEAGFHQAGVPLPDRRYTAPGQVAPADDEQLVVHLVGLAAGHPGEQVALWQRPPAAFRTATWQVSILRAVHVQGQDGAYAPDPLDVAADADAAWIDVAVLQDLLENARRGHLLVGPGVPIVISPITPIGPQGGLAGVQAQVGLALEQAPVR